MTRNTYTVNYPGGLNLRAAAAKTSAVLTVIPCGHTLVQTGRKERGWIPCQYGEFSGFCDARYISPVPADGEEERA